MLGCISIDGAPPLGRETEAEAQKIVDIYAVARPECSIGGWMKLQL